VRRSAALLLTVVLGAISLRPGSAGAPGKAASAAAREKAALPAAANAAAGNLLRWDARRGRVDAWIDGWPLERLLAEVAGRTGWRIRVEPDLDASVFAKFRGLSPREALRRLLGSLNFALFPDARGAPTLYVFKTAFRKATRDVAPKLPPPSATRPRTLENELILLVSPESGKDVEALAAGLGAKIVGRSEELGAYRLRFPTKERAQAARRWIDEQPDLGWGINQEYPMPGAPRPWAGASPSLSVKPAAVEKGGVLAALIDTPVQKDSAPLNGFLLPEIDILPSKPGVSGEPTHGTSMAVTMIESLAKAAGGSGELPMRILPINVYGPEDATTTFEIAQGLLAALQSGAQVINLSLGSDVDHPLIRRLVEEGRRAGVAVLAAAGNEPTGRPMFPAAYEGVVAVTALDPDGRVADYANRGPFVDAAAPGVSFVPFGGRLYAVVGTSPATAYASGEAAALMLKQGLRGEELTRALREVLRPPEP